MRGTIKTIKWLGVVMASSLGIAGTSLALGSALGSVMILMEDAIGATAICTASTNPEKTKGEIAVKA